MGISTTMKAIIVTTYYGTIKNNSSNLMLTQEVKEKCEIYHRIFESDPIIQILNKSIQMFEIPTSVDEFVLGIISICAYGNPAIAQMILLDLVHNSSDRGNVGFEDFNRTFMEYPIAYDDDGNLTEIGKTYKSRWDSISGQQTNVINEREENYNDN